MPSKIELQQQQLQTKKKLSAETAALNKVTNARAKQQSALTRLRSTKDTADPKFKDKLLAKATELEKEISNLSADIENRKKSIATLQATIDQLQKDIDKSKDTAEDELFTYAQKVNALSDKFPVLLFPVKPETRFHRADAVRELWIRVHPDACHAEVQRQYLTALELKTVIDYVKDNTVDIAARHGIYRANFISKWIAQYSGEKDFLKVLQKGDRQDIKTKYKVDVLDSIPPPQALTLPDRFVFRLYNADGKEARTVISKPVPASVFMGFDASTADKVAWMHNFDEAIKIGLGIKITLTEEEFNTGFSKLVVLGVRAGTDSTQSQALLENLLQDHLYSNRGLSLIKQGTITNNADDESTTYSWKNAFEKQGNNPPPPPPPPTPAPPKNTEEGSMAFHDGLWLSQYLGISDNILQEAENAQGTDQRNARSMNTALFPATLGYYLGELMDPLLTDDEINRIESFFSKYVLGRGTIPALRIGKQPYGVLPVSVVPKLNLQASDPLRNAIVAKVQELFEIWKGKSQLVKRISNENPVSTEDFVDILSLHPNSVSFQQRLMEDVSSKLNAVSTGLLNPSILTDLNDWMEEYYLQNTGLLQKLSAVGLDANTQRPDLAYKMFTSATQLNGPIVEPAKDADGNYLKEVFSETQGLKFNYINWLATSDFETIRNETGVPYERKPLLYLFLRHAMLLRYAEAAKSLEKTAYAAAGIKTKYQDNQLVNSPDKSKTALLYKADEKITGSKTLTVKDYIRNTLANDANRPVELLNLSNARSALLSIANLPTAKLERTFVEHIDCCSYRIDAWINALYSIQLRKQRIKSDDTWSKGVYLGAFAYLENLKPKEGIKSQGYILAPSLPHAAAGAILRNAQLTYQGNEENPFNLDISSERVRTALQLLDNMRNGLNLNELLGYRFERALHESFAKNNVGLDKYIYDYRVKYPLAQSQNTQENDGPKETISARNVVDGSKLLTAFEANENTIFDGITILTAEQDIIKKIVRQLQDIINAVKDLMMTEGVYQTMYSNYDRGSAVLDALGQGKFMPDLEVVNTPRTGAILTHRVALHLNYKEPSRKTDSVRAALEPSINEWLYSVLPNPDDVVVNVQRNANDAGEYISQKQLGIEPIDLLYLMNADDSMSMKALDDLVLGYLAGDKVHSIRYKNKQDNNKFTFFELAALIRPLRKIVFQSRYLSANDVKFSTKDIVNEFNKPTASHRDRLVNISTMLGKISFTYFDNITNKPLDETRKNLAALSKTINTLFDNQVSLGGVFTKLLRTDLTPQEIIQLKKEITDLVKLVKDKISAQKAALAAIIAKVNAELSRPPDTGTPYSYENFMTGLKAALGESVLMVPQFFLPVSARDNYRDAFKDADQLLDFSIKTLKADFPVQDWVGGVARVREKIAALESVMSSVELIKNSKVYCTPIQMPYVKQDRWLATQFTINNDGFKASDKLLYTVVSEDKQNDHGKKDNDIFCGFVIDDWTEVVPVKEEKAGLSFQYTRPNAEAPQTMLLMTPPQLSGNWSHEDMMDSIISTFDVVKARAVEPDHLNDTELSQFLPATILFSPLYDTSISTNLAQNN